MSTSFSCRVPDSKTVEEFDNWILEKYGTLNRYKGKHTGEALKLFMDIKNKKVKIVPIKKEKIKRNTDLNELISLLEEEYPEGGLVPKDEMERLIIRGIGSSNHITVSNKRKELEANNYIENQKDGKFVIFPDRIDEFISVEENIGTIGIEHELKNFILATDATAFVHREKLADEGNIFMIGKYRYKVKDIRFTTVGTAEEQYWKKCGFRNAIQFRNDWKKRSKGRKVTAFEKIFVYLIEKIGMEKI